MRKNVVLLILLSCAATVFAQAKPQHVNFMQTLIGLDGKTIPGGPDPTSPAATLGDIAMQALETTLEEDRTSTGEQKFKRDQLARKIYRNKDVVLTVEETAMIKDRIGKAYGPLVVGAAWRLLDPATE